MSMRSPSRSRADSLRPERRLSEARRRGAFQRPAATVAATPAIESGLARIRSCPIIAAARSARSSTFGTEARGAATGNRSGSPSP